MVGNSIPFHCFNPVLGLFLVFSYSSLLFSQCYSYGEVDAFNTFTVSSIRYPQTRLHPFEWRYIRVDLPPWFSSVSVVLESDVDLDARSTSKIPKSALPLICFRDGSFPLPDVPKTSPKSLDSLSNGSSEEIKTIQDVEQCYPMQKNITLRLTNEQVSPGVWYLGLFNGFGAIRTQSKMIIRGASYTFRANISVEGCTTSTLWGPYCNQSIVPFSCAPFDGYYSPTPRISDSKEINKTTENIVSCRNSFDKRCHVNAETKVYSLDVVGISKELSIVAMNVSFNSTQSNNLSGINITCFARHGALPTSILYDYSSDIYKDPLIINAPKVGRWYFTIVPNVSKELEATLGNDDAQVCYSVDSQVVECPTGKGGPNCTYNSYVLQTIRGSTFLFDSSYTPVTEKVPASSTKFPLEPLLSRSTSDGALNDKWTYFVMDIPFGAGGGNVHIHLDSKTKIKYEIYARYGALPSLQRWDYYYTSTSMSSDGSMFFQSYNSSDQEINLYIVYVREGTWSFGIRHLNTSGSDSTAMSVRVERCPKDCKPYGQCRYAFDANGLTSYSYCSCDRRHGGFDCSIEIVSHKDRRSDRKLLDFSKFFNHQHAQIILFHLPLLLLSTK